MATKETFPIQIKVTEEKKRALKIAATMEDMNVKEYILRAVDYYEKNVLKK